MPAGVVTFNPSAFKVRYPQFVAVDSDLLTACFGDATLYLSNTPSSPVQSLTRRETLLNMLTAHIAYLGGALAVDGSVVPVGRLSSGTEGSVSANYDMPTPGSAAWFDQTQWGAAFRQGTLALRSFRYRPCPTRW